MAAQNLTPPRIAKAECPADKQQVFLWDKKVPGLGIRITKSKKVFIFQGRHDGKALREKIGDTNQLTLEEARNQAKEKTALLAKGIDPREEKKRQEAAEKALRQERMRQQVTVAEAWDTYLKDREAGWSKRHYEDHIKLAHHGGEKRKRSKQKTVPGVLASLMPLKLSDITAATMKGWIKKEGSTRKAQTALGYRLFRAFLNWCEDEEQHEHGYSGIASPNACSKTVAKDNLPKTQSKDDVLQKEQLKPFFDAVLGYASKTPLQSDKIISAYVLTLLLTGRRPNEVLSLQWQDIDFRFNTITIHDKVDGKSVIPLTPYIAWLLANLPKTNKWVFSSNRSKDGKLQRPARAFSKMQDRADIPPVTFHGLRRTFKTLSEWIECPRGVVHQIQGHKPSATAEKHYTKRPIDLLRKWHVIIEEWFLEQAGVDFIQPEEGKTLLDLKLVQGGTK